LGLAGIPAGVVSSEPGNAEQTGVRVKRGDDHGTVATAAAAVAESGGGSGSGDGSRRVLTAATAAAVLQQDGRAVLEPRDAQRRIAVAHAAHDPRPRAFYQPVAGEIKRLNYGRY